MASVITLDYTINPTYGTAVIDLSNYDIDRTKFIPGYSEAIRNSMVTYYPNYACYKMGNNDITYPIVANIYGGDYTTPMVWDGGSTIPSNPVFDQAFFDKVSAISPTSQGDLVTDDGKIISFTRANYPGCTNGFTINGQRISANTNVTIKGRTFTLPSSSYNARGTEIFVCFYNYIGNASLYLLYAGRGSNFEYTGLFVKNLIQGSGTNWSTTAPILTNTVQTPAVPDLPIEPTPNVDFIRVLNNTNVDVIYLDNNNKLLIKFKTVNTAETLSVSFYGTDNTPAPTPACEYWVNAVCTKPIIPACDKYDINTLTCTRNICSYWENDTTCIKPSSSCPYWSDNCLRIGNGNVDVSGETVVFQDSALVKKYLTQTAQLCRYVDTDEFGNDNFDQPITVSCRKEVKRELARGETLNYKTMTTYYLQTLTKVGDKIDNNVVIEVNIIRDTHNQALYCLCKCREEQE